MWPCRKPDRYPPIPSHPKFNLTYSAGYRFGYTPSAGKWQGFSMQTVESTRAGDLSVADHVAEMQRWLHRAGILVTDLHALRILRGRVTFSIGFRDATDANRFLRAFGAVDR